MKNYGIMAIGLLFLSLAGCGKQPTGNTSLKSNPAAEQAAIQSAQAWLNSVDEGSYARSWEDAAVSFKSAVSQADWEKAAQSVRAPLGKMLSRKIRSQQYTTSLPDAPAGEYVILQYETAFENKSNAVETVTPMLDKDGRWKVDGYYIK